VEITSVTLFLISKNVPFFLSLWFPSGTIGSPEGEAAKNSYEFFFMPKGSIPLTLRVVHQNREDEKIYAVNLRT
jgi:hypothetical protein